MPHGMGEEQGPGPNRLAPIAALSKHCQEGEWEETLMSHTYDTPSWCLAPPEVLPHREGTAVPHIYAWSGPRGN